MAWELSGGSMLASQACRLSIYRFKVCLNYFVMSHKSNPRDPNIQYLFGGMPSGPPKWHSLCAVWSVLP